MPWRLIAFVIIFAVFLAFITFNLENKCDISFGFYKFMEVPVFVTIFFSFILGLFCALPLVLRKKKPKETVEKPKSFLKNKKQKTEPPMGSVDGGTDVK
jgi:uncharacterized integral membrane protein